MGEEEEKEVLLKDTAAMEADFAGLKFWMHFGEPPSLQHRKENPIADGIGSTLQLESLKTWGVELGKSVLTGEISLKDWLDQGISLLRDQFATAGASIDEELKHLLANASGEVVQMIVLRLSRPLEAVDCTNFAQAEAALDDVVAAANAMDEVVGTVIRKLQAVESLCSPVVQVLNQAHTMIAKIAKCSDPFTMLLVKLTDLVERIETEAKENISELISSSSNLTLTFVKYKLEAVAKAAVTMAAAELEQLLKTTAWQNYKVLARY